MRLYASVRRLFPTKLSWGRTLATRQEEQHRGKKVTHALQTGLTARTASFPLLPQDQRNTSLLSKATLPSQSNLMKKCKLYKGGGAWGVSPLTSETSLNINLKLLPTRPAPSILPEHSRPSAQGQTVSYPSQHGPTPYFFDQCSWKDTICLQTHGTYCPFRAFMT